MVLPVGGTAMTATVMHPKMVKLTKPDFAAPIVAFLCSDDERVPTGSIFEAGAGFYAEWQWRRAEGVFLDIEKPITIDSISDNWSKIRDMSACSDPIEDDKQVPKQSYQVWALLQKQKKEKKPEKK